MIDSRFLLFYRAPCTRCIRTITDMHWLHERPVAAQIFTQQRFGWKVSTHRRIKFAEFSLLVIVIVSELALCQVVLLDVISSVGTSRRRPCGANGRPRQQFRLGRPPTGNQVLREVFQLVRAVGTWPSDDENAGHDNQSSAVCWNRCDMLPCDVHQSRASLFWYDYRVVQTPEAQFYFLDNFGN